MDKTPLSNRLTVVIFGDVNSGKSTMFNAILGQEAAIVSDKEGTTTDPVIKTMELIPFGPIALMDTAGLNDKTSLSELRIKATMKALMRTDFAIYAADHSKFDKETFSEMKRLFEKYDIPYMLVFTKSESISDDNRRRFAEEYKDCRFTDVNLKKTIDSLKTSLSNKLGRLKDGERPLLYGIAKRNDTIVAVCPIDSAAPVGRLILPQVQLIRDCLDNDCKCIVTKLEQLPSVLSEAKRIDLVITDSQIFSEVAKIVPSDMPLTSFSIIMARQKGDINALADGARKIKQLKTGDKVLIAEACTHNRTHDDIGTVKIPVAIKRLSGADVSIDFYVGNDYPSNLAEYKLVVHCGGCMLTRKAMKNRLLEADAVGVPVTNYGVVFALMGGILERSISAVTNIE